MAEHASETPNQNDCGNPAASYIELAANACAAGDLVLGMHLYLAAYEQAASDANVPTSVEVHALREAWSLSCALKERSLAEYVFEKLEPYLMGDEIAECALKLQELALDRLEQYGFSREDLEDMAQTITQDFLGTNAHVVKVESISIPGSLPHGVATEQVEAAVVDSSVDAGTLQASVEPESVEPSPESTDPNLPEPIVPPVLTGPERPSHVGMGVANAQGFNPYDEFSSNSVGTSYHIATNEGSGSYVFTRDVDRATALERAAKEEAAAAAATPESDESPAQGQNEQVVAAGKIDLAQAASAIAASGQAAIANSQPAQPVDLGHGAILSYANLVGYDEAVSIVRSMGVGMRDDEGFLNFVRMLNTRHGLNRMPAVDTLLFRAPVIEDAQRFVEATIGELGLPVLRMSMEEGMGGVPVLCVTTHGNNRPRMNHAHNRFEGPGILVVEDLDNWIMPEMPENPEGIGGFVMANISRGAREAVALIRSAVEDPDVFVLATSSTLGEPDPFFYDMLEPITVVEIGYPNEKERADIWDEIAREHPSLSGVDRDALVRFSEGLARYDLYMAARDALEDAYKFGLVQRMYVPVTPQNLFDKLAACQPLDSDRYRELEEAVIDAFRNDLDDLEDLLGGEG